MGKELFDRFPEQVAQADAELGYSIRALCLEDAREQLNQTQFTQPALYVVNALTHLAKLEDTGRTPLAVAGHSLGEYNALHAAGAFDFVTGLRLVRERGRLMSRVSGGGMAAIIGLPPDRVEAVLAASSTGTIDVANYNSFDQTVIAGPKDDIVAAASAFEKAGARVIQLKVSAPFHSRYMRDAELAFDAFARGFTIGAPRIPIIANATARPYDPQRMHETLVGQITSPVRWLDTVLYLLERPEPSIEEVGPGTVLSRLTTQILRYARTQEGLGPRTARAPDVRASG
jgi:polyketide biosynthesis malonyl-CoA-[acyl-carrier-protein] transacylase/trans-AT polyketide synthase/acyltransferase/oxidoreductase domain-containing protein